jgi:membrane fusion protein, copper/silver efflux system
MSRISGLRKRIGKISSWIAARLLLIVFLVIGIALGHYLTSAGSDPGTMPDESANGHDHQSETKAEAWTCSMHPQIQMNKPGQCPICGMDLILVADEGGGSGGLREFRTSEAARQLMNIEVAEVERRFVTKEIRMVGKVDFDETKLGYITAWVPGRLDRLYVDYTGIEVKKGDHMVYLYSPELLVAQEELRRSAKTITEFKANAPEVLRKTAESIRLASREKLGRWGLTESQIDKAEKEGISSDHITIYSPMSGTVIHKTGQEGMYVNEGSRIYTISDLSTLWVKLDAYESDLPWLHYGQTVQFTTEAYPGDTFEGKISFIDPVLTEMTRTVKVRVVVPNPDGKLKPEMFVRSVVQAQVATGGRVMDPGLAGKWISPMHPEIIKDKPGTCDVCGMALVKAEDLGYVSAEAKPEDMPLVIPVTAPLVTGTRAIVYVEVPDADAPTYEGREIVLGPRAGNYYIVRSGLEEGERVVTCGNFKIDSALQIQAKPSMMSPDDDENVMPDAETETKKEMVMRLEAPEAFQQQLHDVYAAYLSIMDALASDAFEDARKATVSARTTLNAVDMKLLQGDAHIAWMGTLEPLGKTLDVMAKADAIEGVRAEVPALTATLQKAIVTFGLPPGNPAYRAHCPMAFDNKGADWLQAGTKIRNPYYGSMMLECGAIEERLDGASEASEREASHE